MRRFVTLGLGVLAVWTAAAQRPAAAQEPAASTLRWRFALGQQFIYETHTTVDGALTISSAADADDAREVPLRLEAVDRTRYEVKTLTGAGLATLEARLLSLTVTTHLPGSQPLTIERRDDALLIRVGEREWLLPPFEQDPRTPAEVLDACHGWDPQGLLAPSVAAVTPSGVWTQRSGQPWSDHLARLGWVGQLAAYCQPFGRAWPELPSQAVAAGDEWEQVRAPRLPGDAAETYPLPVVYSLGADQQVDGRTLRPVSFEGAALVQDRAARLSVPFGLALELTIGALSHRLSGQILLDATGGRWVSQELRAQVSSQATETNGAQPTRLDSAVTVSAESTLVETP